MVREGKGGSAPAVKCGYPHFPKLFQIEKFPREFSFSSISSLNISAFYKCVSYKKSVYAIRRSLLQFDIIGRLWMMGRGSNFQYFGVDVRNVWSLPSNIAVFISSYLSTEHLQFLKN